MFNRLNNLFNRNKKNKSETVDTLNREYKGDAVQTRVLDLIAFRYDKIYKDKDEAIGVVNGLLTDCAVLEKSLDPVGTSANLFEASFITKVNRLDVNYFIASAIANSELHAKSVLDAERVDFMSTQYAVVCMNCWGDDTVNLRMALRAHIMDKTGFLENLKSQSNDYITGRIMAMLMQESGLPLPQKITEAIADDKSDADGMYEVWKQHIKPLETSTKTIIGGVETIEQLGIPAGKYITALVSIIGAVAVGSFDGNMPALQAMISDLDDYGLLEDIKLGVQLGKDGDIDTITQGHAKVNMEDMFTDDALEFIRKLDKKDK